MASDADVNPDTHRLLNFHRQIGITEPQCPVPVGPQPDAISDPCQNLFINVPAVRSPVIFMQQSASRALVPTVIGDLLRTVPVAALGGGALGGGGTSRLGGVLGGGTSRTRLGEDGASRPRLLWFPMVFNIFQWFSYGFHNFPMVFLWFPMVFTIFQWFSYRFHNFPIVFLWFSQSSYGFPMVFTIFLWFSPFSNGFPMVFTIFLWFSYGFLWFSPFSNGFPMVCLWFSSVWGAQ